LSFPVPRRFPGLVELNHGGVELFHGGKCFRQVYPCFGINIGAVAPFFINR
jgi:hypothetical protein